MLNLYSNRTSKIHTNLQIYKLNGFSILEILIALGLMSILMFTMITMQQNQAKESRALGEKLASLDFFRTITSELSNYQSCNALFLPANVVGGAASLANLNLTTASTTPVIVNFNSIAGVSLGGGISPEASTAQIQASNGIQLKIISPTKANVTVNIENTNLVRPLRPLTFPLNLNSSGALNSTTIIGCMNNFSGAYVNVTASRNYGTVYTNTNSNALYVVVTGSVTANISQGSLTAIVDGVTIQTTQVSDANSAMGWMASPQSISFIVPPGLTYQVVKNLGNISLISWFELN